MKITLYSKSDCPFCQKAKAYLEREGFTYSLISLENSSERVAFYDLHGITEQNKRTMPQIFLDEERIGGYEDMIKDDRFHDKRLIDLQLTPREFRYVLHKLGEPNMGFSDIRPKPGEYSAVEVADLRLKLKAIFNGRSS